MPGVGPQRFGLRLSGRGSNGVFSALRWCPRPHRTGVIASVKLSSSPALCWRCCRVGLRRSGRCRAGVCRRCARVPPALQWPHRQHRAVVVVAGVAPALSPSSRGRFCPRRASIVALVAFALPPASRTEVCPVTKQSRHTLVSLPASRHRRCPRCAGIVALVVLAFPPSSHPRRRQHHELASALP
jgi:hypothetical protein